MVDVINNQGEELLEEIAIDARVLVNIGDVHNLEYANSPPDTMDTDERMNKYVAQTLFESFRSKVTYKIIVRVD